MRVDMSDKALRVGDFEENADCVECCGCADKGRWSLEITESLAREYTARAERYVVVGLWLKACCVFRSLFDFARLLRFVAECLLESFHVGEVMCEDLGAAE